MQADVSTQIVEQIGDKGKINWSEGYVEATGVGKPPEIYIGKPQAHPLALRMARIDAFRNLLETTKGVRVNSTKVVKDFTTQNDAINTEVSGLVKAANIVSQEYMYDGTVVMTVRMPLSGSFTQIILSKAHDKKPEENPSAIPAMTLSEASAAVYTGVVVDARGIKAHPAMSPRILDENGKEVYGSMIVVGEYAVQQGMSGYTRDLAAAQTNPRVASKPVSIRGIKAEGAGRSDIVIRNADADKIRASKDYSSFLRKCRVMVVLD